MSIEAAVSAVVARAIELRLELPLTQGEFALELVNAAKPHLMAAAWEEGREAGNESCRVPNPYRSAI